MSIGTRTIDVVDDAAAGIGPAAPSSSAPLPRRRLSPDHRRSQIVAAGAAVFTSLGYQATSLEDIAASIGVTRPLIYRYFRDKDELYLEILRKARDELDDALLSAVDPTATPADQLRVGVTAYFAFVHDRGQEWDLLFGGGAPLAGAVADEAEQMRIATIDKVVWLVRAAAPHVAATTAAAYTNAIVGAAQQLALWWRDHPEVSLAQIVETQLDVVWNGLERISTP